MATIPYADFKASLSVRARNCLYNDDINSWKELRSRSKRSIHCIPNFGKVSIREVAHKAYLAGVDLDWGYNRKEPNTMAIPTKGETFAKLTEHLRLAQEDAAMMAHLINEGDTRSRNVAIGWLHVENQLKLTVHAVTALATKGLQ